MPFLFSSAELVFGGGRNVCKIIRGKVTGDQKKKLFRSAGGQLVSNPCTYHKCKVPLPSMLLIMLRKCYLCRQQKLLGKEPEPFHGCKGMYLRMPH